MDYWTKRGFKLIGVSGRPNTWIASNGHKAAVIEVDFWDNWNKASDWFGSVERATSEALELASV
jgi:hypothetical protein